MKRLVYMAFGAVAACAAASLVVHRRVITAAIKGDPLSMPPEWHKWHLS